jgi:hypothetical protein
MIFLNTFSYVQDQQANMNLFIYYLAVEIFREPILRDTFSFLTRVIASWVHFFILSKKQTRLNWLWSGS